MDLDEHSLNEAQRTLKRLGVTHVWRQPSPTLVERAVSPEPIPSTADDTSQTTGQPRREAPIPSVLKSLFHGKQSPVRTLWTYSGLYADMQQRIVPPRLEMFRRIQASVRSHLGWADEDVCSWPLDVAPDLFFQGVGFFRPRIIIFFGPGQDLPEVLEARNTDLLSGCAVHVLPDLGDMSAGNQQLKNEAWQVLQTIGR